MYYLRFHELPAIPAVKVDRNGDHDLVVAVDRILVASTETSVALTEHARHRLNRPKTRGFLRPAAQQPPAARRIQRSGSG